MGTLCKELSPSTALVVVPQGVILGPVPSMVSMFSSARKCLPNIYTYIYIERNSIKYTFFYCKRFDILSSSVLTLQ